MRFFNCMDLNLNLNTGINATNGGTAGASGAVGRRENLGSGNTAKQVVGREISLDSPADSLRSLVGLSGVNLDAAANADAPGKVIANQPGSAAAGVDAPKDTTPIVASLTTSGAVSAMLEGGSRAEGDQAPKSEQAGA